MAVLMIWPDSGSRQSESSFCLRLLQSHSLHSRSSTCPQFCSKSYQHFQPLSGRERRKGRGTKHQRDPKGRRLKSLFRRAVIMFAWKQKTAQQLEVVKRLNLWRWETQQLLSVSPFNYFLPYSLRVCTRVFMSLLFRAALTGRDFCSGLGEEKAPRPWSVGEQE